MLFFRLIADGDHISGMSTMVSAFRKRLSDAAGFCLVYILLTLVVHATHHRCRQARCIHRPQQGTTSIGHEGVGVESVNVD